MPGPLIHSPAKIVSRLMIQLEHGSEPNELPWPVYYNREPGSPDHCVTVYDTLGRSKSGGSGRSGTSGLGGGRTHVDGERQEHHGIQVRVRTSPDGEDAGYEKCREIEIACDSEVLWDTVEIDESIYMVQCISRVSDTISLGPADPAKEDERLIFVFNALVMVRMLEAGLEIDDTEAEEDLVLDDDFEPGEDEPADDEDGAHEEIESGLILDDDFGGGE